MPRYQGRPRRSSSLPLLRLEALEGRPLLSMFAGAPEQAPPPPGQLSTAPSPAPNQKPQNPSQQGDASWNEGSPAQYGSGSGPAQSSSQAPSQPASNGADCSPASAPGTTGAPTAESFQPSTHPDAESSPVTSTTAPVPTPPANMGGVEERAELFVSLAPRMQTAPPLPSTEADGPTSRGAPGNPTGPAAFSFPSEGGGELVSTQHVASAMTGVAATASSVSVPVTVAKSAAAIMTTSSDFGGLPVVTAAVPNASPTLATADGTVRVSESYEGPATIVVDTTGTTEATAPAGDEADQEPTSLGGALVARGADLLASCAPFDQGSLERALDHFLDQLGEFDAGLPALVGGRNWILPGVVSAVVALTVAETVHRRSRSDEEKADDEGSALFPGLPGRRQRWALED
jgi:hypothetical protein